MFMHRVPAKKSKWIVIFNMHKEIHIYIPLHYIFNLLNMHRDKLCPYNLIWCSKLCNKLNCICARAIVLLILSIYRAHGKMLNFLIKR